jgi:hypothetical protein
VTLLYIIIKLKLRTVPTRGRNLWHIMPWYYKHLKKIFNRCLLYSIQVNSVNSSTPAMMRDKRSSLPQKKFYMIVSKWVITRPHNQRERKLSHDMTIITKEKNNDIKLFSSVNILASRNKLVRLSHPITTALVEFEQIGLGGYLPKWSTFS